MFTVFYVADSYIKVHRSTVMTVCIGDQPPKAIETKLLSCMLFISLVKHDSEVSSKSKNVYQAKDQL